MDRKLTRKDFLRMSGVGLAGATLLGTAACGGTQSSGGNTLEFWNFSEGRDMVLKELIESDAWKKDHPDVEVNIRLFPFAEMHNKLQAALVSGQGAPDIADVEINQFARFAGDNAPFLELNDRIGNEIDNLYTPAATDPWSWEDVIYGLGDQLNVVVLAYRQDIMDEVGVKTPFETWDEVVEAGKAVVSNTESKMFAIHDINYYDYRMILQNAGGEIFDEQGNYAGNSDLGVAAMQFNHDLVYEHEIAGIAPATAADDFTAPQYIAAFKASQYVAMFGPPWQLSYLILNVEEQAGQWTMQELPRGIGEGIPTGNLGGTGMCITNQSQNPDLAWELIQTANLTVEGIIKGFELRTTYPTYKPAYEDVRLQKPNEYFNGVKVGELYESLAPQLPPYTPSKDWLPATDALVREVITPVMQNKKDAKLALDDLATEIERIKSS